MGSSSEDWESLVAAERLIANLRANLLNSPESKRLLSAALRHGSNAWDRRAALNFLHVFPRCVPDFVVEVLQLALGESFGGLPRDVLAAGPRFEVQSKVIGYMDALLATIKPDDCLQLGAIVRTLGIREAAMAAGKRALESSDQELREVGRALLNECGSA